MKNRRFTLVELLVVIAIIAILAGLVFAAMSGMKDNANKNRTAQVISAMYGGIEAYKLEKRMYPMPESTKDYNITTTTSTGILTLLSGFWNYDATLMGASGTTLLDGWQTPIYYYQGTPTTSASGPTVAERKAVYDKIDAETDETVMIFSMGPPKSDGTFDVDKAIYKRK